MRRALEKTISWSAPVPAIGAFGGATSAWTGDRVTEPATIGAASGGLQIAAYGQTINDMRVMNLERDSMIDVGCGVWVNGAGDAPDYVVTAVRRYPMHTEADVKRAV